MDVYVNGVMYGYIALFSNTVGKSYEYTPTTRDSSFLVEREFETLEATVDAVAEHILQGLVT